MKLESWEPSVGGFRGLSDNLCCCSCSSCSRGKEATKAFAGSARLVSISRNRWQPEGIEKRIAEGIPQGIWLDFKDSQQGVMAAPGISKKDVEPLAAFGLPTFCDSPQELMARVGIQNKGFKMRIGNAKGWLPLPTPEMPSGASPSSSSSSSWLPGSRQV